MGPLSCRPRPTRLRLGSGREGASRLSAQQVSFHCSVAYSYRLKYLFCANFPEEAGEGSRGPRPCKSVHRAQMSPFNPVLVQLPSVSRPFTSPYLSCSGCCCRPACFTELLVLVAPKFCLQFCPFCVAAFCCLPSSAAVFCCLGFASCVAVVVVVRVAGPFLT